MQLDVTGQNIEITQSLKAYIAEKTERLERHFNNLIAGHFVLHLEKLEHTVEGTISVAGRTKPLHAEAKVRRHVCRDRLADGQARQASTPAQEQGYLPSPLTPGRNRLTQAVTLQGVRSHAAR